MILVTKTTTGLLIQRDALDIQIDAPAVALALPSIIATLIDSGRALGQARREGYDAGLIDGRERAIREAAMAERIAERDHADAIELLLTAVSAHAA